MTLAVAALVSLRIGASPFQWRFETNAYVPRYAPFPDASVPGPVQNRLLPHVLIVLCYGLKKRSRLKHFLIRIVFRERNAGKTDVHSSTPSAIFK
jgi:hypothetical protein